MQNDYDFEERVAIKIDSHIPEKEAIRQAKHELETPECIERLNKLKERKKLDDSVKHAKQARRYNYE